MMAMGGGKGMLSVFKAKTGPGGKVTGLIGGQTLEKVFHAVGYVSISKNDQKSCITSNMHCNCSTMVYVSAPANIREIV